MNTAKKKQYHPPSGISKNDALRLVSEIPEELGIIDMDRIEMICLMRKIIRLGIESEKRQRYTVTFRIAAEASLKARMDRRACTVRDLKHYISKFLADNNFADRPIRDISQQECRTILTALYEHTPGSFIKARAIMHSVFAYAEKREWCDKNPVKHIEKPRLKETENYPLSPEECERLLRTAMNHRFLPMLLSVHLMMFCGIRPAEVQRLIPARDIDTEGGFVQIRSLSSKTGGGRVVPLRTAARLKEIHAPLVIPINWEKEWRALRQSAGFGKNWQKDVLRHTFATYHAGHFANYPELQAEMGHRDLGLLRSRYINGRFARPDLSAAFWELGAPSSTTTGGSRRREGSRRRGGGG